MQTGEKKHRLQDYQKRFWKIAKASNEMLFNYYKNKLAAKTPKGWDDLQKTDPIHWCRAFFKEGSNCESVDNNVSESFNSWIIDARFKPIIAMLEDIRIMVTRRIQENRSNSERWTMGICPNILRKVNKIRHATQYCHVLWNGASGFEVRDKKWRFTVDLEQKTCSCGYWQVSGLPCRHACAALFTMSDEPNNYVNACFSIDQYKATYQHVLQPVEHESAWPVSPNPRQLPPRVKKMPGRPQTKRRMDPSQRVNSSTKSSRVGVKIKCRRCKGTGHNAKSCTVELNSASGNNPGHSHGPSSFDNNNAPLAIETATSKGKGTAASSGTKSNKRKAIEGYGLYYSERTGSSFIQTGKKSRLVSFGTSNSKAKASAVGNASVVIETSAGHPTSSARATINVTSGRATAEIKSTSTARGGQKKSG